MPAARTQTKRGQISVLEESYIVHRRVKEEHSRVESESEEWCQDRLMFLIEIERSKNTDTDTVVMKRAQKLTFSPPRNERAPGDKKSRSSLFSLRFTSSHALSTLSSPHAKIYIHRLFKSSMIRAPTASFSGREYRFWPPQYVLHTAPGSSSQCLGSHRRRLPLD